MALDIQKNVLHPMILSGSFSLSAPKFSCKTIRRIISFSNKSFIIAIIKYWIQNSDEQPKSETRFALFGVYI